MLSKNEGNLLIIVFDSVRYDRFMEASAPNLKALGRIHKAYSHGSWTVPSIYSMLYGHFPQAQGVDKRPVDVQLGWLFYGTKQQGYENFFINDNAWINMLNLPNCKLIKYSLRLPAKEIIVDMLNIMNTSQKYCIFTIFLETHLPYSVDRNEDYRNIWEIVHDYNNGLDVSSCFIEAIKERQRRAITYLDDLLKPVLDRHKGRVIFTSDHGDLQGEYHKIGHGPENFPFDEKLFEVPLIVSDLGE